MSMALITLRGRGRVQGQGVSQEIGVVSTAFAFASRNQE